MKVQLGSYLGNESTRGFQLKHAWATRSAIIVRAVLMKRGQVLQIRDGINDACYSTRIL